MRIRLRADPLHLRLLLLLPLLVLRCQAREASAGSWDYHQQDQGSSGWGELCDGRYQSPIDIEPANAVRSDIELRLEYKPWRMEDVSSAGVEADGVPRVRFKKERLVGKVQAGTGYSDFDEYVLTSVEVHSPSEHTLRKASWALELQLWHEPMPLLSAQDLLQHTEELAQDVDDSKTRFSALDNAEAKLREQTMGKISPWSGNAQGGIPNPQQTLDWIDATKGDIASVGELLQQDSKGLLERSMKLEGEVKRLVDAQKRPLAGHRLALSLFVLRASPVLLGVQNGSATPLVRWLSNALSSASTAVDEEAPLELSQVMQGSSSLYGYQGSVPRPPCTPNVRWFVLGEPLASSIDQLSVLLRATQLGNTMQGDAREVQAFGQDRKLHQVDMKWKAFGAPAILASADSLPPSRLKMLWIERYCKVFFVCSVFLILTPLILWVAKRCAAAETEDDMMTDMVTPLSHPLDIADAEARLSGLSVWTPKKREAQAQSMQLAAAEVEALGATGATGALGMASQLQGGSGEPSVMEEAKISD